ncbi:hypothetical protein, partial [Jonquetella sp. BV3C21]|uniref:hypothetical protein n=1 Tax=Jonquetella sp. BV3C21 TaxID=1111126 RepID=UPI001E5313EA
RIHLSKDSAEISALFELVRSCDRPPELILYNQARKGKRRSKWLPINSGLLSSRRRRLVG